MLKNCVHFNTSLGSYCGHTLSYASLTTFNPTVTQKVACDVWYVWNALRRDCIVCKLVFYLDTGC